MAEDLLFTVAGSVAMPAQMISLEEAGLEQRAERCRCETFAEG